MDVAAMATSKTITLHSTRESLCSLSLFSCLVLFLVNRIPAMEPSTSSLPVLTSSNATRTKAFRQTPYRSNAPPRSPGPPPDQPLPSPPPLVMGDSSQSIIERCWALDAIRYATIMGAFTLNAADFKQLKSVPRTEPPVESDSSQMRLTRTRSKIIAGQRIDFGFCTGSRVLKHKGMPMYALANAPAQELYRNMNASGTRVMAPFSLRRICLRIEWPLPPTCEHGHIVYEEWVGVHADSTRVDVAMAVARVFRSFVEEYAVRLGKYCDYPWLLRPDAFYKVWLLGLERVDTQVFVADLKYIKHYPDE